jgi:protein phosphatase 1 regulatory subunit 7
LKKLTDIFFVQNKISRIEGLEQLTAIKNLELGANKIRVRTISYPHMR